MTKQTDDRQASAGQVERPVRPALPEREDARVYAELRELGYTWHQAHETMQRIAAEREQFAKLWKHHAYAALGMTRDSMSAADIDAVQRFLGPL